jgi:hypothetical protein
MSSGIGRGSYFFIGQMKKKKERPEFFFSGWKKAGNILSWQAIFLVIKKHNRSTWQKNQPDIYIWCFKGKDVARTQTCRKWLSFYTF